jgi:peptidyl-prolyl cis-trans isomerase C
MPFGFDKSGFSLHAIGGILLPIAFVLIAGGCIERRDLSPPEEEPVVARIDGKALLKKEFEMLLPEDYQNTLTAEEKKAYLDKWITTELLYREALRRGLGITPEIKIKLEQYKKDLVADRLVQDILHKQALVSEAEVRAYYNEHEKEYTQEYRVSHILLNTLEDAQKVKKLTEKAGFYWLAKKYSVDKHTRRGGDLGFLSKGNMIPEFEKVVFNMKVGEVSDIIETDFGYHIIKLTDVRPARHKLKYDDVKDQITNMLLMRKRTAVYDSLITSLREGTDIEVIDGELKLDDFTGAEDTVSTRY